MLAMFLLSIAMQGKLYGIQWEAPLEAFAFIANLGAGFPYFLAEYTGLGIGSMNAPSYDYSTTFTLEFRDC